MKQKKLGVSFLISAFEAAVKWQRRFLLCVCVAISNNTTYYSWIFWFTCCIILAKVELFWIKLNYVLTFKLSFQEEISQRSKTPHSQFLIQSQFVFIHISWSFIETQESDQIIYKEKWHICLSDFMFMIIPRDDRKFSGKIFT